MDPTFYGLIPDLQDIICGFAYETNGKTFREELDTIMMIKRWGLHHWLIRDRTYSVSERYFTRNATREFRMSSDYDGFRKLFHWDNVYTVLYHIDFRLKLVKSWGPREHWYSRMGDWRNIAYFACFVGILQEHHISKYLKPSSKNCLPCKFYITGANGKE